MEVENEGTSTWRPTTSIIVPSDGDWEANCPSTPSLAAGSSSVIKCAITIPLSEEAGSEPVVTLRMEGEGCSRKLNFSTCRFFSALDWNLRTKDPIAHQNYPAQLTIEFRM